MNKSIGSLIIICFSGLLLAGCVFFQAPDKERACDKMISREKMADLLTEIYLLEGYLNELEGRQPSVRDSVEYQYAWLFYNYQTTPWEFRKALNCYLLDRAEMELIHEQILSRFSLMESELDARDALEKRRQEWQQKTESNRTQLGYPSLLPPLSWEKILESSKDTSELRINLPADDHQPDSAGLP